MARFCPLFSSSSGNAMYIGCADGGLLIDAGMSAKQLEIALHNIGVSPEHIRTIFVTHEHNDHVKGLRVFASRYGTRVMATEGTLTALDEFGHLTDKFTAEVLPENGTETATMLVKSFKTSHDCRETCGYTVTLTDGRKIGVATDLGVMTGEVQNALTGCDLVLLESNHDVGMLENGPYPYYLKRRILSDRGHLSNLVCAETVKTLVENGTTRLFLGHLSRENNLPALAYQTSLAALSEIGAKENADFILKVAAPACREGVTVF